MAVGWHHTNYSPTFLFLPERSNCTRALSPARLARAEESEGWRVRARPALADARCNRLFCDGHHTVDSKTALFLGFCERAFSVLPGCRNASEAFGSRSHKGETDLTTDRHYRDLARRRYSRAHGEIEITDNAQVSPSGDAGAFVAAWVWVPNVPKASPDKKRGRPRRSEALLPCRQQRSRRAL